MFTSLCSFYMLCLLFLFSMFFALYTILLLLFGKFRFFCTFLFAIGFYADYIYIHFSVLLSLQFRLQILKINKQKPYTFKCTENFLSFHLLFSIQCENHSLSKYCSAFIVMFYTLWNITFVFVFFCILFCLYLLVLLLMLFPLILLCRLFCFPFDWGNAKSTQREQFDQQQQIYI